MDVITVIAGVGEILGADEGLTKEGQREVNLRLTQAMVRRWPDTAWTVVPDGPSHRLWSSLVAGAGYAEPTEEQREFADETLHDILAELPESCWEHDQG